MTNNYSKQNENLKNLRKLIESLRTEDYEKNVKSFDDISCLQNLNGGTIVVFNKQNLYQKLANNYNIKKSLKIQDPLLPEDEVIILEMDKIYIFRENVTLEMVGKFKNEVTN